MLEMKIDSCLRDENSGASVFDMLPAWKAEYEYVNGIEVEGSGGLTLLDHYMRMAMIDSEYDEIKYVHDDFVMSRIGRCVFTLNGSGFYAACLHDSIADAEKFMNEYSEDTDEV
jgi:hypothetical protein